MFKEIIGFLRDIVEVFKLYGSWAVVAVCVMIIGLLLYLFYKYHKANKDKINIKDIIANHSKDFSLDHKVFKEKLSELEQSINKLENAYHEFDKNREKDKAFQETMIRNVDQIIQRILDVTVELKNLSFRIKEYTK